MAHPISAIKRHRQSLRRQERNTTRRTTARSAVRRTRELIAAGNEAEAAAAVRATASALDRAARKGVIHPNNAARRKSRLMRQVNAMGAGGEAPKRRAAPKSRAGAKRAPRSKKS